MREFYQTAPECNNKKCECNFKGLKCLSGNPYIKAECLKIIVTEKPIAKKGK
jgi:hypothetical protein